VISYRLKCCVSYIVFRPLNNVYQTLRIRTVGIDTNFYLISTFNLITFSRLYLEYCQGKHYQVHDFLPSKVAIHICSCMVSFIMIIPTVKPVHYDQSLEEKKRGPLSTGDLLKVFWHWKYFSEIIEIMNA
jgi:uncharacterized membrane protein